MDPSRSPMCRGIGLVRSRITLPSLAWVFSRCSISLSTSSHDMLDTDANHCSYSRSRSCQNVAMSFLLFLAQLRCTWQQGLHIHALSASFDQHASISTLWSARFGQHASLSTSHSARLTQHASLSTPRSSSSHLHSTRIARFAWQSTARLQPSCLSECQSVRVRAALLLFSILFSPLVFPSGIPLSVLYVSFFSFFVLWDALPLFFCKHAKLTVIACSALYGLLDEPVSDGVWSIHGDGATE